MHGRNEQRHAVISYEIIEWEWPMNTEPAETTYIAQFLLLLALQL